MEKILGFGYEYNQIKYEEIVEDNVCLGMDKDNDITSFPYDWINGFNVLTQHANKHDLKPPFYFGCEGMFWQKTEKRDFATLVGRIYIFSAIDGSAIRSEELTFQTLHLKEEGALKRWGFLLSWFKDSNKATYDGVD